MIAQNSVCNSLLLQEAVIGKYSKSILVRKKDVEALKEKEMDKDDANILAGTDENAPKLPNLFK